MKKFIIFNTVNILMSMLISIVFINTAQAYWIWTPESKKFVNPKYAAKDSPKEQFDWALEFYKAGDYKRAAVEFEKLTRHYEYSEYASRAQYHVGLCYEALGKFYTAFQAYQKAIDNFPHIENIDEIIEREFNIGVLYLARDNPKILGVDIITSLDRAVEIFKKVVDNAPYGKFAEEALIRLGEALKGSERYDEAVQAFQRLVDDYPNSNLIDRARYEAAYCAYRSSLKPAYDVGTTDKAIEAFEEFVEMNRDEELQKMANMTIQRLKDKAAEKSFSTAKFYESQKHYTSAIIYYQDVVDKFPDSSFANEAKAKLKELKAQEKER